ncbi:unnamed protein product [Linum tenue]|uniref:F-box domain-containing protein n=1 Tax=Linum tenue TaxID=586396 RepID=A0AAV0R206_9ROSI|nr:unnamed protein product [Linum tenue]
MSELPEDVIHKILTRIEPSKEAAKTSVLSQRWANLWRSYPVLEFDDTQFATKKSAKRFAAALIGRGCVQSRWDYYCPIRIPIPATVSALPLVPRNRCPTPPAARSV